MLRKHRLTNPCCYSSVLWTRHPAQCTVHTRQSLCPASVLPPCRVCCYHSQVAGLAGGRLVAARGGGHTAPLGGAVHLLRSGAVGDRRSAAAGRRHTAAQRETELLADRTARAGARRRRAAGLADPDTPLLRHAKGLPGEGTQGVSPHGCRKRGGGVEGRVPAVKS